MGRLLRKVGAVLRQFDTSLDGLTVRREDTKIVVTPEGLGEVHLLLRSSEVSGVWLMRYEIAPHCLRALRNGGLIESRGKSTEGEIFVLTRKGLERLGKS